MLKSKVLKVRSIILAGGLLAAGVSLFIPLTNSAEGASQPLIAHSQFRRVADPSPRSSTGTLALEIKGELQTVTFDIRGLAQEDFATYFSPVANFPFEISTNFFVYSVSPLDQTNLKQGDWHTRLVGTNEAPPLIPFIDDLTESGPNLFSIGVVNNSALIVGVTNIVGTVTNVIMGIPVPLQDKTNTVSVTMWAPSPALSTDPASLSYHRKATLTTPAIPPVPGAKGMVKYRFDGSSGRSQFEVDAFNLPRGQAPHVFIADSLNSTNYNLIDAGTMTPSPSGRTDKYIRDTQFGDPLPQQVRDAGDLSGRVIEILDLNGNPPFVYLEGTIP
jgi:hypothetical protein